MFLHNLSGLAVVAALVFCSALASRAGSTATQTVQLSVEPIAVLAVKHGGDGPGGVDLGNTSHVSISPAGIAVYGNRLVWTANIPAKVTVQSSMAAGDLRVRATQIRGRGAGMGWVPVGEGGIVVEGIDREIGGCSLDYSITRLPDTPMEVTATYTITAQ